jgi:anaphase-promoting complex subunit 5
LALLIDVGFGDKLPDDVRKTCQMMLQNAFGVPNLLHFVRFFDSWREGDYTMAMDNLHRYFDHTMFSDDRIIYQYALLHTAVVQADFGCFSEAVAAMTEAIATARENHDISCLNFSISWLYHLTKAYPRQMKSAPAAGFLGSQQETLAYLKQKGKQFKVPNLLSSTLLEEAKLAMASVRSCLKMDFCLHLRAMASVSRLNECTGRRT